MADIIRMAEFHGARRPNTPSRRAADRAEHTGYFCTRCRCESFSLLVSGAVQCVNCGARVANVRLVIDKLEEAN
jgi:DNA-directed RNA polymerase subunit RPC12/RpoP